MPSIAVARERHQFVAPIKTFRRLIWSRKIGSIYFRFKLTRPKFGARAKENDVSDLDYPACLRELYQSEVFGETFAHALMNAAKNDRDRYHFATLLQLETETKARLRPFLVQHGLSLEEDADVSQVEAVVGAYQTMEFQSFTALIKPSVEQFLKRFEEIEQAAPEADHAMVASMVKHERAILTWLEQESCAASDTSLDAMIAELQYPILAPA